MLTQTTGRTDIAKEGPSSKSIVVCIINWNSPMDTIECLEALRRNEAVNVHVLLLDNGSGDDSVSEISEWLRNNYPDDARARIAESAYEEGRVVFSSEEIVFLASKKNLGFASGNNSLIRFGLEFFSAQYFFLLNNDAILDTNCLPNVVKAAEETGAQIVGALVMDREKGEVLFSGADPRRELFASVKPLKESQLGDIWTTGRAEGSAMLISREFIAEVIRKTGYVLDPDYFLYCEDSSLCLRAASLGRAIVMTKSARIYHRLAGSSGGKNNRLQYYYRTRNKVRLAGQWLDTPGKILFHLYYPASRLVRVFQYFISGQPEVASAILRGMFDGYMGVTGKWRLHD